MNAIPSYLYSAALIAFGMVSWPLLAKVSNTPAAWVTTLVLIGTLIGNLAVGWNDMVKSPLFNSWSFGIMMVAGLVNGIAVYYYGAKSADPAIPTWVFVASINIMMVVFAAVLGSIAGWSLPTPRQFSGIILAGVGIYLIAGK